MVRIHNSLGDAFISYDFKPTGRFQGLLQIVPFSKEGMNNTLCLQTNQFSMWELGGGWAAVGG